MTKRSRKKASRIHILAMRIVFERPVTITEARGAVRGALSVHGFDFDNIEVERDDGVVFGRVASAVHTGKVGR